MDRVVHRHGHGICPSQREIVFIAVLSLFIVGSFCIVPDASCARSTQTSLDVSSSMGIMCHAEDAAFLITPPSGWYNDAATATDLGVCAMFMPSGAEFHSSPAVLYPRAVSRKEQASHDLAIISKVQAEHSRTGLASQPGGTDLSIREAKVVRNEVGSDYAIWLFDQGPPPNEWEAASYTLQGRAVLMLVLSARAGEVRDRFLPVLEETAGRVVSMQVGKNP